MTAPERVVTIRAEIHNGSPAPAFCGKIWREICIRKKRIKVIYWENDRMKETNAVSETTGTPKAARNKHVKLHIRIMIFGLLTIIAIPASGTSAAEPMHGEIARYEGARTCAECHDTAVKEVTESLHYQKGGEPRFSDGWEKGKDISLLADLSPLYHTYAGINWLGTIKPADVARQEQQNGCAVCHMGVGKQPNLIGTLAADDSENIDCLICHGPDYRRAIVKEVKTVKEKIIVREKEKTKGKWIEKEKEIAKEAFRFRIAPAAGVDVLKVARQAQKTSAETCLRCHGATVGGNFWRGIAGGGNDVHFSMGMSCTECHTVKKHKIAGGAALKFQGQTEVTVGCPNCHTEKPHKGDSGPLLNKHTFRIACQTCHVPAIARHATVPTVTDIDWTTPIKNEKSGLFEPAARQGSNLKPEYLWWNRTMRNAWEPAGSKRDRQARIYPWQRINSTIIADAATGMPLPLKISVYAVTGDPGAAAAKGAAEAKQPYSGKWKAIQQTMLVPVNHQVAPKAEALKCDDCHDAKGRIDLKSLGYGR